MTAWAEAMVVGGGPAGAALATLLARAGGRVVLIERTVGAHDKVCGEFLSAEALGFLSALGCDPFALGAVPIRKLCLAAGARETGISLPFPAASLSRRVLDEALLRRAGEAGAAIRRGAAVRALDRRGQDWHARLAGGGSCRARDAFIATGKHDIRGRGRGGGAQFDLIAFKMHFQVPRAASRPGDTVDLALFPGGYVGLEPIEGGRINLCLLVRRRDFARLGRRWDRLLAFISASAPLIAARLDGAVPCWDRPLAVGAVPFGHLRREAGDSWWLGDQAAVVPSFAGSGISLALHSAALAASVFLAGGTPGEYQRRLARDAGPLVRYGTWLSRVLIQPAAQPVLAALAHRVPGLLSRAAQATRLPQIRPPVSPEPSEAQEKESPDDVPPHSAARRLAAGGLRR